MKKIMLNMLVIYGNQVGLGAIYTMDHEVGPRKMAFVNGPTLGSKFHGPTS
jgi:hypothetical protein